MAKADVYMLIPLRVNGELVDRRLSDYNDVDCSALECMHHLIEKKGCKLNWVAVNEDSDGKVTCAYYETSKKMSNIFGHNICDDSTIDEEYEIGKLDD